MASQWEQLIAQMQQDPALAQQFSQLMPQQQVVPNPMFGQAEGVRADLGRAIPQFILQPGGPQGAAPAAPVTMTPVNQFNPDAKRRSRPEFTQAGMPGNNPPLNPFDFGPSTANPHGRKTGQSPEISQMNDLGGFINFLQDPQKRVEMINTLGASAPAPSDKDLQDFVANFSRGERV